MKSPESQLCLACGLCCQGILHPYAILRPDEIDLGVNLGFSVGREGEKDVFYQPCPCYGKHRCLSYDQRPKVCVGYRCKLLRRVLTEEISFQDAFHAIEQMNRVVESLYRHNENLLDPSLALPPQISGILEQQRESVTFRRNHTALLLDIGRFHLLVGRYFALRPNESENAENTAEDDAAMQE